MSRGRSPARAHRQAAPEGKVRIIGGHWRGTRLPVADAPGLRPSGERSRETLFNWLQPLLPGAVVLDAFSGSGALGLEALSRGAAQALLVERDPRQVALLAGVLDRLGHDGRATLLRGDALQWLRGVPHRRFDGVFLDPPFDADLWQPSLELLQPWLAEDAWLYIESPAQTPWRPGAGWSLHREMATRHAHGGLYRRQA